MRYTVKPGKREEFLQKAEPGNCGYEYFKPIDSENTLFLMELWADTKAQAAHGQTEHYQRLQLLKQEYVTDVKIEKYRVNDLPQT